MQWCTASSIKGQFVLVLEFDVIVVFVVADDVVVSRRVSIANQRS